MPSGPGPALPKTLALGPVTQDRHRVRRYRAGMASCDRQELRDVSAAVLAVTSHLSVREVLQTILATARRLVHARYAALGIPDERGSFAEFLADGLTDEQWRVI